MTKKEQAKEYIDNMDFGDLDILTTYLYSPGLLETYFEMHEIKPQILKDKTEKTKMHCILNAFIQSDEKEKEELKDYAQSLKRKI